MVYDDALQDIVYVLGDNDVSVSRPRIKGFIAVHYPSTFGSELVKVAFILKSDVSVLHSYGRMSQDVFEETLSSLAVSHQTYWNVWSTMSISVQIQLVSTAEWASVTKMHANKEKKGQGAPWLPV